MPLFFLPLEKPLSDFFQEGHAISALIKFSHPHSLMYESPRAYRFELVAACRVWDQTKNVGRGVDMNLLHMTPTPGPGAQWHWRPGREEGATVVGYVVASPL